MPHVGPLGILHPRNSRYRGDMVLLVVHPRTGTLKETSVSTPLLTHDDLAHVRGEGIFEAALVRDGVIAARDLHLDRFCRSGRIMDFEPIDREFWDRALTIALDRHISHESPFSDSGDGVPEFAIKWVLSRGTEDGGSQVGWIETSPVSQDVIDERSRGIRAVTLSRGYQAGIAVEAPWLLIGAKTLSYAVNMASTRFAQARGGDDAIWTTTDGFVLEAPRSNIVILKDNELLTPDPTMGLLHGTTQQLLFSAAREKGWRCRYARLRLEDLYHADAAWFTSSLRKIVPITQVNSTWIDADTAATESLTEVLNNRAVSSPQHAFG